MINRSTVYLFFCLMIFSLITVDIKAQSSCGECGLRIVGIYDPSILVPKPADSQLIPRWWQLFRIGDAMRAYLHNEDASHDCITFFDIHITISDSSMWANKLKFGTEWAQTPPAGPVNNLDYLIESSVSGTEGNYTLNASLQAAVSREVVATGSIQFADMWEAMDYAKKLAAQSFAPLFNKINNWEKKKREEDPDVAIGAEKITITPAKNRIEATEQVTVDFVLKDCDGEPLKNKKLQLIEGESQGIKLTGPKGGHYTQDFVITDDEGKAQATFVADKNPGTGILTAYFVYKYPSGHNGIAGGQTAINISQAPVKYWEINGEVFNSLNQLRDTTWSLDLYGVAVEGFFEDNLIKTARASVHGIIENEAYEAGKFWFSGTNPYIAVTTNGTCSEVLTTNKGDYINGIIVSGDKRIDATSGRVFSVGLQFIYDEESGSMAGLSASFQRIGEYNGQWYNGPDWVDYGGKYNDSLAYADAGFYAGDEGSYLIKTDTGYSAGFNSTKSYTEPSSNGTEKITEVTSMRINIRPYSFLTSVDDKKNMQPDKFVLYQNYPNPFNPSTNINFFLTKDGNVTLKVYDILGKEITTLINGFQKRGLHSVNFDASNLPSGFYFYQIKANGFMDTQKMLLIK